MQQFFFSIYTFIKTKKISATVGLVLLFFVLGFFASRLHFSEDITRLIPSTNKSNTTAKVLNQLNFSDKITIKISAKNSGTATDLAQVATLFLTEIDTLKTDYISKIQGKIDEESMNKTFDFVYQNLPLFLDSADYAVIDQKLQTDSIAAQVKANYKSLISPAGLVSRDYILKDPLGISFIALKKMQQLSIGSDFLLHQGFIVTKDKKNLLLFLTPKLPTNETDKNTLFVAKLNEIKDRINIKFKNKASLQFYGATPVAVGNATQIKTDVQLTSIFAGVVLLFVLAFFYKNVSTPLLIFIPSILGALFALAVLYFVKGSISAISLGISSILLGETTDYSIYVLTHLRNNKNVKLLYQDISKPLILCGLTTSISFLCLFFVNSEALKDLGLFAALCVTATSVFSLVLIPFLYRFKKDSPLLALPSINQSKNIFDFLGTYSYHKNKYLVGAMLVLLVASFFTYSKVGFSNDLAALNFVTPQMKQTEKELEALAGGDSKSIYLACYGANFETVLANNKILFDSLNSKKSKGEIVNFSSIGGFVFSKEIQNQKINQWHLFWNQPKKDFLKNQLIHQGSLLGFKANSFEVFYNRLNAKTRPITLADYQKIDSFFIEEFVAQKNGFYTLSTLVKVPAKSRDFFVNQIKKQPALVVIDRQETNEAFLGGLKNNFGRLIDYSFAAVVLLLFLFFRRVELVIISVIPIVMSWVFTMGLMGFFGLEFNIINSIVCTLVFGIGVDYSIFMTSALQKEHTFGQVVLPTYKTSILLSVTTTILGIGVLVFAQHPALKSIALIAVIGIFSALMLTFIIQPLVFGFFVTNRVKNGQPPFEIKRLIHSVLSFIYYGLGGFLLSIISAFLMKVLPFSKKIKLQVFHFIMSKFMHSVLVSYPSNRRIIKNESKENFKKPAIIIANHTSFLDILAVGMLSPKIVFLVSDWVYNSPIFGKGVRLAGFYPVSSGIDNGIEHLKSKVAQGFSLMVFPEGTRSVDNSIKRFHKGAFYLAQELQLDIIPVVIHGYSEVLPKGDFLINGGKTTVEILERISPNNLNYGVNLGERTKKVSQLFKAHFKQMRTELEGENYFKKMLLNSFDYKEIEVVQAVKQDFYTHASVYHKLNSFISDKAKILHLANDYGQLDVLLSLQESQRKVTTFIANDLKRAVAQTNYWLGKRSITYILEPQNLPKTSFDVLLISDKIDFNSLVSLVSLAQCIVLFDNESLKNEILLSGFEVTAQTEKIIVLNKKTK